MASRRYYEEMSMKNKASVQKRPSRGELSGLVLAIAIFFYGLVTQDVPVVFLALSFILFELRPLAEHFAGVYGKTISSFLWGFSLALFFSAVVLLFF